MFEKEWDREELDWILEKSQQIETPFFLLNENRLKENVDFLKKKAGADFAVCFSVKANPWYAVKAAENADYVEVCSHGEWELCKKQGISAARIIVGGIYKSNEELKELVEARPHRISIESMQQLKQVDKHASASGIGADILLRISSGNQFGMDPDLVIDILKHQDRFPALRFKGIHFYSGTQKRQEKEIEKDIDLIESVVKQAKGNFTEIEYGPGVGVSLFQNHDSDEYKSLFFALLNRLQALEGQFRIVLECGRLLTADTGIYVTEIVDKKINNGRTYYIVDGGIHHLQYYGQIKGQYTPFIYTGKDNEMTGEKEVTICGALCTANDVLVRSVHLPEKNPGDRLVFMNAGAYCVTEGISLFLSRDLPGIVMEKQHELAVLRNHIPSYPLNIKQE
ncbi:MAG: hypothetical protein HDR28_12305 [Lachnospiraceae bacterium]|nr:hypothetical protein [Lachnospiraceae bacterium]